MGKRIESQVIAYYVSFCYPAADKPYATVDIQYKDGAWDEIYRTYDYTGCCNPSHQAELAKVVIERHAGKEVSMAFVRNMLEAPARSYTRTTPAELDVDMENCSQVPLFWRGF